MTSPFPPQLPNVPPPPAAAAGQASAPSPPTFGSVPTGPPPPAPWGAVPPAAPTKKRKKGIIALIVVSLVVIALAAALALGFWYNSSIASAAAANVPADAPIGSCFGADGSKQEISCDGPHVYEVYSESIYFDDVDYPSGFGQSLGNDICENDLEFATGENYFLTDWDYVLLFPTEADWASGERRVPCVGLLGDGIQVTSRLGR